MPNAEHPRVGIIMGSDSDLPTMQLASNELTRLDVPHEVGVVSAHRTPAWIREYVQSAVRRNIQVIIAGAGGAAHLPGMVASETIIPVIGVPIQSKALNGQDSLLSIVQMPGGIPVNTMAIGDAGATNAGLSAARILALNDSELAQRLMAHQEVLVQKVLKANMDLPGKLKGLATPVPIDWVPHSSH